MFSKAVLPHSPGVVYYHLLLEREIRIPGVASFSYLIGIWDLLVHRGQKTYTPTAFGKLWTIPELRCTIHASGFKKSSLFLKPVTKIDRTILQDVLHSHNHSRYFIKLTLGDKIKTKMVLV